MASSFKNTTISSTDNVTLPNGASNQRTAITPTIVTYTSGSGTWTVPTGVNTIEVLVVAGGGGGAGTEGGGGGAGGLVYNSNYAVTPGANISYSVGNGGSGSSSSPGSNGGNSTFGTITAIGGGGGGGVNNNNAASGGSGGGGGRTSSVTCTGGAGTAGQGFAGGTGLVSAGFPSAGGGGAGGKGGDGIGYGSGAGGSGGGGGPGLCFDISGTPTWYAGGGGGGAGNNNGNPTHGAGGIGGGGAGGTVGNNGTAGQANTGGGGGGAGQTGSTGGNGGSGVIILRYYTTTDSTDPRGIIRYNTTTNNVETWGYNAWQSQESVKNNAGYNLQTYSEQLNSALTAENGSVSSDNAVAPNGTTTADTYVPNTSNTFHRLQRSVTVVSGQTYTASVYAKASGYNFLHFRFDAANPGSILGRGFDLSTGTSVAGVYDNNSAFGAPLSYAITDVGNGWYRCSVTVTATGTTSYLALYAGSSASSSSFAGNGSSGIILWGLQLEQASEAGSYQRTEALASPVPTTVAGYKIHKFTSTGTTYWSPEHTGTVEVLVVGGGGGGGTGGDPRCGGGGGGGVVYDATYPVVAGKQYTVTVGAGGSAGSANNPGSNGGNSQFGSLLAVGGGGGGASGTDTLSLLTGRPGGSGGGGGGSASVTNRYYGGPGVPGQGSQGGTGEHRYGTDASGAGGGGAGSMGQNGGATNRSTAVNGSGGNGGAGFTSDISGSLTAYAGGGAGGDYRSVSHGFANGAGGGAYGVAGTANTGGGGGGTAAGGSGIVIVRYLTSSTTYTPDGSSANNAATSALAIKNLTGTTTDGLYWININGTPTQVYCDMNTAGGGWMHCGTFADGGEATNNANHIWGAPLNSAQDTGIWQNTTTTGSQSFTADYKNGVWVYYPMTQFLIKDSGASLRNLFYTKTIPPQSLSEFWAGKRWMADASDQSLNAMPTNRVHVMPIVNFGVNDPVFGSSSLNNILIKWGERDGVQDGNKDRAMISYETTGGSDVDEPKGIGCFTNRSGTINYRDIVPNANKGDFPPDSITGTHALTMWVR